MIKFSGSLLAACALVYLTGAHWFVLQSIAWTNMIVTYSEEFTLVEAIKKTFDGSAPCEMCKSIVKERKKQEQDAVKFALGDKKIEAISQPQVSRPMHPPTGNVTFFSIAEKLSARNSLPEIPPPRIA